MKEDAISSSCDPILPLKSSSPPHTSTPAASSAGASSPALVANAGSTDWLGNGQGSKTTLSLVGSQQLLASLSTSACGSALGSSCFSCRPWERSDLLKRLSTFNPENWFGKPKAASSLACARRGWVNVDVDKIECESCNASLGFLSPASRTPDPADGATGEFAMRLDAGHKVTCPWRGNICAESLAQFPPASPSALIGGYKDRCEGLLQFSSLPVVSSTAIEQMQSTRGLEIDRFLAYSQALAAATETRNEALNTYSRAQKLIGLCGWEPRWHQNVLDSEENSAHSARNGCSTGPVKGKGHLHAAGPSKKALSSTCRKDTGKKDENDPEAKCESRSPILDCSLCGATVRIWEFLTVSRPTHVAPTTIGIPEPNKKLVLTRGVSAASGICGWVPPEQVDDQDEAGTAYECKAQSNVGIDLALTMGGGMSSAQMDMTEMSGQNRDANVGRDLIIGQPTGSELGGHAASYESRGPTSHKRHLEEGGSTADRPSLVVQQADSVEGTVIDRDGEEVDDGIQYSAGPSKRARESDPFDTYNFFQGRDSSGAGPSNSLNFDLESYGQRQDPFVGGPSTRDSTQVSSVIAMDIVCHDDENSMESVENYPCDMEDVHFPSPSVFRTPDMNEMSEFNYSNQAQQSNCAVGITMGVSSTNDGEELLNTDTTNPCGREGQSFGISGGSVGMGASHEAEIHGIDLSIHRTDSGIGDVEPVPEITENQGQTGEFVPDRGVMGDFVPGEVETGPEYRQGDSQDLISRSVGRADSGSKIFGSSAKAESVESGEKTSNVNILPRESSIHPSLSCNAVVYSGFDASKEEVTQAAKASLVDDGAYPDPDYVAINGIGPPNVESNYEDPVEFDPIKHHNYFCPWVNVNVAAAGVAMCSNGSASNSSSGGLALCGWQLTLDALDAFQSLGHVPAQADQSESAASQYKDDRLTPSRKMLARRS